MIGDSPDTDPTFLGLLQAVCASPDDDTPRLVLADWWEEHGQPDRAEFVRVQCELAKPGSALEPLPFGDPNALAVADGRARRYQRGMRRRDDLRWRERKLRASKAAEDVWPVAVSAWADKYEFSRGFISSLTCPATDFLRVERALLWSPETMTCRWCKGTGLIGTGTCSACGGNWATPGSGRITLPRPTDVCESCRGIGSYLGMGWESNPGTCHKESPNGRCINGRVPRPCPPTAQPITKVALTTRPEMTGWYDRGPKVQFGFGYDDRAQPSWTLAELGVPETAQYDEIATAACNAKWPWPWITFEVNTGNTTTQPWQPEVART